MYRGPFGEKNCARLSKKLLLQLFLVAFNVFSIVSALDAFEGTTTKPDNCETKWKYSDDCE